MEVCRDIQGGKGLQELDMNEEYDTWDVKGSKDDDANVEV